MHVCIYVCMYVCNNVALYMYYQGNISAIFSSNSDTSASELLENLVELFPHYCIDSDIIVTMLNSSDTYIHEDPMSS